MPASVQKKIASRASKTTARYLGTKLNSLTLYMSPYNLRFLCLCNDDRCLLVYCKFRHDRVTQAARCGDSNPDLSHSASTAMPLRTRNTAYLPRGDRTSVTLSPHHVTLWPAMSQYSFLELRPMDSEGLYLFHKSFIVLPVTSWRHIYDTFSQSLLQNGSFCLTMTTTFYRPP